MLDLSSLTSMNHGSTGGAWNDTIQAINGGVVDLSGLRTVTVGINGQDDDLNLTVNSGGQINLDALETVVAGTHGGERIRFNVGEDTTLDMPSLESLTRAEFSLGDNATINAANLSELRFSTLTAQAGRTYNFGPLTNIYNTRLYAQANASNPAVSATSYQWDYGWHHGSTTIFSADGANAVLDLSSLTSMNHGSTGGAWNDTIQAINGGVVDLSGLRTVTVGINGQDDDLNLTVNSGGQINLDALQTIVAQGNGNELLRFNVGAGSTINAPSLLTARRVQFSMEAGSAFHAPSLLSLRNSTLTIQPGVTMTLTSLFDMRNSTLNVLDGGKLRIGAPLLAVDTTILVDDFGSELQLDRSLNMRGASAITITNGASLRVGGDLTHSTMLESNYQLDLAIVDFFGAGQRYLEVGGLDLGEADPGNNGNFGIGRLEIGLDGSGTYVRLTDFLDNGNRQMGQLEAIYLFGLGGFDGLELGVGAVLNLGNLNAYAFMEGAWMRLNNLFTPGSSSVVALGDGHLILPSPASACLIALALACQSGRRRW